MSALNDLTEAIKKGDRKTAVQATESELADGTTPDTILQALVLGMDDVGQRFKANQIFVPEVLIAARAMKESMAILEPKLVESGYKPLATAIVGTVQGDLHDIGKNLVVMMLKGASFNVVDLGTNVTPDAFVQAAQEHNASVIGLSALLTTTMPAMKTTIDAIRDARIDNVNVIVGGAPVTQAFADEIGADAFAPDAASAVDTVRSLVSA